MIKTKITRMKKSIFFYFLVLISLSGCSIIMDEEVGNGIRVTEEKKLDRFEDLEISGSFEVELVPSDQFRVMIEADENIQEFVRVDQEGDRVKVRLKNNVRVKMDGRIKLTIYMQELRTIELAGSGKVKTRSQMSHPDRMEFTIAGSGDMDIDVKSPRVEVSIGGSGEVNASGKTKRLEVDIAGSGDFIGEELLSEDSEISIAGSGNASVFASTKLDVSIAGSGDVQYRGNPTVSQSIAGRGSVKKVD